MSELAAGFRAGTQMAQSALDAYNSAKAAREEQEYRDELEKINQERNLKALGIEPSGGIGVRPVQLEGIQQVPGAAPTGPNYLASMPNAVAVPDIGLGAPGQAQPFTGFTGGAAQLAESMDPRYGLQQKIALAEKYGMDKDYARYLGQQDRVGELERAEAANRESASRYAQDFGLRSDANARANAVEQRAVDAQALEARRAKATNTFLAGIASGDMSTNDAAQFAADNDVPLSELVSGAANYYNLEEADFARTQKELSRKVAGLSLNQLIDMHKTDDTITPGRHYEVQETKGGVMLVEMDTETGEKIRDLQSFPSEMAAENSLRALASDYGTAVESLVNQEAKQRSAAAKAAIERAKIAVDVSEINAGLRKEAVAEIGKLKSDPMFMAMTPGEQDVYIARNIFATLGLNEDGSPSGVLSNSGLSGSTSASTRGMPPSTRFGGGTSPNPTSAPAGQGGGLGADRARQAARERAEADMEYPVTPQELESYNEKFPEWVKYTNPAELVKMANEYKFRELLGSFEKVPTAMERTAQGTSARRAAE